MDDQLNKQIEMQNKISNIVKKRQEQITELKRYFDVNNTNLYKEIILFGNNLSNFEELFNKGEYRLKCENIFSLALSIGRILDLNNSVKTILIALKIFDEHQYYLKYSKNTKNFISKIFENNPAIPLLQNDFITERIKSNSQNPSSSNFKIMYDFYNSLNKNDSNFYPDFNKYFAFQTDSKSKNNSNFNYEEFNSILYKITNGSYSQHYKFYSRVKSSFEFDYPNIIITACDIFFLLYNKMMDKICYNPNLIMYIEKLDQEIVENFIRIVSDDLQQLSEYILNKECEDITKNLEKIYK